MNSKNKYRIVTDPKYGYLRVDPIPMQEEVEHFYSEEFYSSDYKQFNESSLEVQMEEQDFLNSSWESICDHFLDHFSRLEGLSVFDIGFGFGQALLYFREKGLIVSGLEPSLEGVKYARSQGLNVFQAGIEDLGCVGSQRFNIVTIFNVLEHLRHPAETLINIREKLLKHGGLLVIDVPNEYNDFQTIVNAEYNLSKWWICPPNHINYFSVDTIKHLLVQCGYNIVYYESSFPLEIFMLFGDVYIGNSELGRICHQRRVKFEYLMRKHGKGEKLGQIYKCFADLNLGRQIVIFATPQGEI